MELNGKRGQAVGNLAQCVAKHTDQPLGLQLTTPLSPYPSIFPYLFLLKSPCSLPLVPPLSIP